MAGTELAERVGAVRAFNRFYTAYVGALGDGHLHSPYSLTEVRVLYELGHRDVTEAADLRRSLDLDASYLSRILARFEVDGLVTRARSTADARRQLLELTAAGRSTLGSLETRTAEEMGGRLAALGDDDQRRLVAAMGVVRRVLDGAPRSPAFVIRPPRPGDIGWVVHRHGVLYAREYGWDETFEALVARVVADYVDQHDPDRDSAWIAEVDGEPVGSVFCVAKRPDTDHCGPDDAGPTAKLRLLLVEPSARGLGIGSRLVEECLGFARRAGYRRIELWTNDVLVEARRIYERAGFELVEEEPYHGFGHDLVGQTCRLNLSERRLSGR